MIESNFDLEKKYLSEGYEFVIGVDEAGRGPLAGPVVAAAAIIKVKNFEDPTLEEFDLVRDSKTLSAKQREKLFDFIQENFYIGLGIIDHKTIDRINILEATYLAAKAAVSDLFRKINQDTRNNDQENFKFQISNSKQNPKLQNSKTIILFDGGKKIPNMSYEQKAIVNGDKYVKSISAASIIAKVTRDRLMLELHEKYPEYFFDKHKGYGTKLHMEMLSEFGPCEIHRKSFEPVARLVKTRK